MTGKSKELPRLVNTETIEAELEAVNALELEQGHRNWIKLEKENPNNFSNWFPHFVGVFSTPKSVVYHLPEELMSCFFLEKLDDRENLLNWIAKEMLPSILNDFPISSCIFLKNGCFSNKFDFARSCFVTPEEKTAEGLLKHILNIEEPALSFGTYGDLEFIARQWIEPVEGTPTIYNGMPLRPEVRIFYDFDRKKLLYDKFYWDWDYCFSHIEGTPDEQEYTDTYPVIFNDYLSKRDWILEVAEKKLAEVEGMEGIWSVDFLLDKQSCPKDTWRLWMIDAAVAWQSVYWDPSKAGLKE